MKIKGSVEKIKFSQLLVVYIFALVSCTGLRIYHCMKNIDMATGFYVNRDFTVGLFYGILSASVLFILVAGYLSKDDTKITEKTIHSNIPLGIVSLFLSFSMLLDFVYSAVLSLTQPTDEYQNVMSKISGGSIPYILFAFFSVITCIYFFLFAITAFRKKGRFVTRSAIAILPLGWACTKMIPSFIRQISFIQVSDLFLEICVTAFLIVYTLSLAQCLSGIYSETSMWRLTSVGLVVSLLAFVLNVPKIIFVIMGTSEQYITSGYPTSYSELLIAVFAIILIFSMRKRNDKKTEEVEITEISD